MKKFSSHIKESSTISNTNLEGYDPIYEGVVKDFLRVAKDKMFSKTVYIEREEANEIKHIFTVALISSIDVLKFKKLSLTNFIFNPKDIVKQAQVIFSDPRLIKDISGHGEDAEDVLKLKPQDEGRLVPLIDEILDIVKDVEKRLKKYAKDTAERKFSINVLAKNPGANKRIVDNFIREFNKIFLPTDKRIKMFSDTEGKETDTPKGNSRYEILAYKIIRAMKRQYGYDIENSFIIPKDYDPVVGYTIHGIKKDSKGRGKGSITREQILKLLDENNIGGSWINKVYQHLEKEYGYLRTNDTVEKYYELFIEAYSRIYVASGVAKPTIYAVADKMADIIEDNELDFPTIEGEAKKERARQKEEAELDKELEKDVEEDTPSEDSTKEPREQKKAPKPGSGRGQPVETVGNLEL